MSANLNSPDQRIRPNKTADVTPSLVPLNQSHEAEAFEVADSRKSQVNSNGAKGRKRPTSECTFAFCKLFLDFKEDLMRNEDDGLSFIPYQRKISKVSEECKKREKNDTIGKIAYFC